MMVTNTRHLLLDAGHVVVVDGGRGVVVVLGAVLALHCAHVGEIIKTHPSCICVCVIYVSGAGIGMSVFCDNLCKTELPSVTWCRRMIGREGAGPGPPLVHLSCSPLLSSWAGESVIVREMSH